MATAGGARMKTGTLLAEINDVDEPSGVCEAAAGGESSASLAVPRRGHVLSTVVERYGGPLRQAVSVLKESLLHAPASAEWERLFACRITEPGCDVGRSEIELGAWFIVAAWVVGVATRTLPRDAGLVDAEAWFAGATSKDGIAVHASAEARLEAERLLHGVADEEAFADLLPYILDPHGVGSRLSVRRRPETMATRERKRADGIFYTPADVAAFMAKEALRDLGEDAIQLTVFDPACGSGVFLRAVLTELRHRKPSTDAFDLACSCLYGVDIDPWAVKASTFVLLHDCFDSVQKRGIPPITAWHALRLNFAHLDALRLDPGDALCSDDPRRIARLECRARLKAGDLPPASGTRPPQGPLPLHLVFPELAEGPCVVIGNPPYANIGENADLLSLIKRFETFQAAPRASSDMYPLFVEQMTRLTAPNARGGAMVLPLSIACNTGRQFVALRKLLARTPGHWRFAFFDREPHALFGEDVKTRNAIILWTREGVNHKVTVSTGPLRKWRGHSRARMLESITFTSLDVDIRPGIPKIEGRVQAEALTHLLHVDEKLQHAVTRIGRATLDDALRSDEMTVYVGATAYNFLNVFLRPVAWKVGTGVALTENPLHALVCPSRQRALQAFAILSSRLAFWWWHALGDGFHVSRHVLETMPIGLAVRNERFARCLSDLGETLWRHVSGSPIVSINRGRTSVGFSAVPHADRDRVDALLIEALGLEAGFAKELERFCNTVTTAHVPRDMHQHHQRKNRHDSQDLHRGQREEQANQRGMARVHQDRLVHRQHDS